MVEREKVVDQQREKMADERICNTVAQLCSLPQDEVKDKLESEDALENFCEDPSCQTLYVRFSGGDSVSGLDLSNTAYETKEDGDGIGVQFIKTKEEELSAENFTQHVMVTSTSGATSSLQGLYQTLKTLYAPAILKSQSFMDKLDRYSI